MVIMSLQAVAAIAGLLLVIAMPVTATFAQVEPSDYPSREIRLVVPAATGASVDLVARLLGVRLSEAWGQRVIVDNRPGAGGATGVEQVVRAPADGYTLLMGSRGPLAATPALSARVAYDSGRDLAPITLTGASSEVLVVHPSLPVNNPGELIALAKRRPGAMSFGSSGAGGSTHLTAVLFMRAAGIQAAHRPFVGHAMAVDELAAGNAEFAFASLRDAMPKVRDGRLRALALASALRVPVAPAVSTLAEAGLAGFDSEDWQGVLVPAGTPKAIIDRLHAQIHRLMAMPDVRDRLAARGFRIRVSTPEAFAALIRTETVRWAGIVKETGLRSEAAGSP